MMQAAAVLSTSDAIHGIIVMSEGVVVPPEVPILDSHCVERGALGHLLKTWTVDGGLLMGEMAFTGRAGRRAFQQIERGEIDGCSCHFKFKRFSVFDTVDYRVVEPGEARERGPDDANLVIVIRNSRLLEVSICAIPADRNARVWACSERAVVHKMIASGEAALERILGRELGSSSYSRTPFDQLRRRMPARGLVQYRMPEALL